MGGAFVSGADLMEEIHRSTLLWCSEHRPEDAAFHGALLDERNPTDEELALAAENFFEMEGRPPRHVSEIVFRKPTWAHIPEDQGWRAAPSKGIPATGLPFPPFEHYRYRGGRPVCVLRSHWTGSVGRGRYRTAAETERRMTERLGEMILVLAERYGGNSNWSGYTNVEEMQGDARLALTANILKFSPLKSSNPFAYATRCMQMAFTANLNDSKERWGKEWSLSSPDMDESGKGFDGKEETWAEASAREFDAAEREFKTG